jgi:hypothetical protein
MAGQTQATRGGAPGSVSTVDISMVTESGDVPVPAGAIWATIVAPDCTGARPGEVSRTVVHVARSSSVSVEVGAHEVVMIEWLFDSDSTDAH